MDEIMARNRDEDTNETNGDNDRRMKEASALFRPRGQ